MKATRHLLLISLFCSCFSLQNCSLFDFDGKPKTELEKLPRATNTGEGTFGCLVDGKAWVAKSDSWSPPAAKAFYQEGRLSITGVASAIGQTMRLSLYDLNLTEQAYALNAYPDSYGILDEINTYCEYITSSEYSGQLTITHLDKINYIISGTFEFEAYSVDCSKKVTVTKGRFDLQYAP
jgi:hypothetical protein